MYLVLSHLIGIVAFIVFAIIPFLKYFIKASESYGFLVDTVLGELIYRIHDKESNIIENFLTVLFYLLYLLISAILSFIIGLIWPIIFLLSIFTTTLHFHKNKNKNK